MLTQTKTLVLKFTNNKFKAKSAPNKGRTNIAKELVNFKVTFTYTYLVIRLIKKTYRCWLNKYTMRKSSEYFILNEVFLSANGLN